MFLLLFLLSSASQSESQKIGRVHQEQTTFGGEEVPGIPFIKRPAPVPNSVLNILKEDRDVKACSADNPPTVKVPLALWFVASEVHLGGNREQDLVVLASPRVNQPDYACFHTAGGFTSFWVFRVERGNSYLLLRTIAFGIAIKKSRHQGYRDIETGSPSSAGRFITTVSFRFDGKRYEEYGRNTRPNSQASPSPQPVDE